MYVSGRSFKVRSGPGVHISYLTAILSLRQNMQGSEFWRLITAAGRLHCSLTGRRSPPSPDELNQTSKLMCIPRILQRPQLPSSNDDLIQTQKGEPHLPSPLCCD